MDRIVYVLVSNPGGVDGLDNTDKGGKEMDATFVEGALEKNKNYHWGHIEKRVVELGEVKAAAMAKLSMTEKLVLELLPSQSQQAKR